MNTRTLTLTAAALAAATTLTITPPASAHTPSGGADCTTGIFAQGTGYDAGDTNSLAVALDPIYDRDGNVIASADGDYKGFGNDGYLSIPVPQDGARHTYVWIVATNNANPAYSATGRGSISCGTPPPVVKRAWFRVVAYCNTVRVEGRHHVARIVHTRFGNRGHRFVAHAAPGARFANGATVKVKRAWTKRVGCGSGS